MKPTRLALFLPLLCAAIAGAAELQWPAVTSQTKPWSRWWWMGSIGTEREMTVEMEKYAKAGLGGREITPIYGVRGKEKEFRQYLTPEWMRFLSHALKEAKRLDLGIDMATGNGWPFGGPWVTAQDACRYVAQRTYTLKAGESLAEPIRLVQTPLVRALGPRRKIEELKEPVAANDDLQALALEQVRFPASLPLVALRAYSDRGQSLDLTGKVDALGKLHWTAPAGAWSLYAIFQGWHGKLVERAGPGGEGDVIDHFSDEALRNYLARFDERMKGYDLRGLRAYFNDSYEVDDAAGESDWTPGLFDEFRKRRGYDLKEHLPALFGKDTPEKNIRVLSDYRETISDLLLDRFTVPWRLWAERRGATTRNQAHGSPANILDLYAASGIPETEGEQIQRFLFASSAGHVTGKRLVSAEAATWLDEHFTASLGDVKRAVDLFFLGGVNHICYHGTNFSPENQRFPGWLFYASVHFGPTNSFWGDFPILNRYVSRVQSFLQQGQPANDALLYFNIYDQWAEPGRSLLQHLGGAGPATSAGDAAQVMMEAGYSLDLISDRQLSDVRFTGGALQTGGVSYQVVVLPETRFVPLSTLQKVLDLARAGARIAIHKSPPRDVAGWAELEPKRAEFRKLLGQLKFSEIPGSAIQQAPFGQGRILMGADLNRLLTQSGVRRETMVDRGLQFVRRRGNGGQAYFIVNQGRHSIDGWIPFGLGRAVGIFDPMREKMGVAASRPGSAGGVEAYLQLAPGESAVVRTFETDVQGPTLEYWKAAGPALKFGGAWSLRFVDGGRELPAARPNAQLGSWTAFEGDAYKTFSGTARYAISLEKPESDASAWLLDFGTVADSARVYLNGKEIAGLIQAPFRVILPANQLQARNTLEVAVSNVLANRMAGMDRRGEPYRVFYNINFPARRQENRGPDGLFSAAKWEPRPSGLIGPFTMTPLVPLKP